MKTLFLATLTSIISFCATAQTWSLDKAHSKLGFSIPHMMISETEGFFKSFNVTMKSAKPDFSDAVIELTADVNSINTEDEGRDKHLQNEDFFNAPKYPTITFKSTSMKKAKGNMYKLAGNLTMHGVTKPVVLDVKFNGTANHPYTKKTMAGFKVMGTINRKDFGVGEGTPNAMVGEKVTLVINIEMAKD